MAPSNQNFPGPSTGIPASSSTEFWYSATTGNDGSNSGAFGFPIKTITKLGQLMFGFGNTGSAILYTDAALTDAESTLFYQLTANDPRQWSVVNGAMPFTPAFWFDARDYKGLGDNNATLTNGQSLAGINWINKGSQGGQAVIQAGVPLFLKTASAGKLRNAAAVDLNTSGGQVAYYKTTGMAGGLTGPTTWVTVFRVNDQTTTNRMIDGSNNSCGWALNIGNPPAFGLINTGSIGILAPDATVTQGSYNYLVACNNAGGSSGFVDVSLNGIQSQSGNAIGTNFAIGCTIGAWNDGSAPAKAQFICHIGVDGAPPSGDPGAWDQWMQYNFAFNGTAAQ